MRGSVGVLVVGAMMLGCGGDPTEPMALGALRAIITSDGVDLDVDGYVIAIDDSTTQLVGISGAFLIVRLPPGTHQVSLTSVPDNCSVDRGPLRSVTVAAGDTAEVAFDVRCVWGTGAVEVTAATTGLDHDLDGYAIRVDGLAVRVVGANAAVAVDGVTQGSHTVTLEGVAANCALEDETPHTVTVSTGGFTRDTARTTFAIACTKVWTIAFASPEGNPFVGFEVSTIRVTNADGSVQASLAPGDGPAWSPDGSGLVFAHVVCDYYYFDYDCHRDGLFTAGTNGAAVRRLTSYGTDADPTWRPDGARIAFTRERRLHLMNADGSGVSLLDGAADAAHPDWSPDGSRLAFTCEVDAGNQDICVINTDGTGLTRLTSDPARDARPSWGPDGSQIVFTTSRYSGDDELALMAADGGGVTQVSPGMPAREPAWSPDGQHIVFSSYACSDATGCTMLGLFVVEPDGASLAQVTSGRDNAPVWRPR